MNREWHRNHRLARNASKEERIAWHREHAKTCGCRPPPGSIAADLRKRQRSVRSAD
jgi:hypothetical protein